MLSAILLDLVLPDATGPAAVEALLERAPDVPILVLSSSDSAADVRSVLGRGARGYVPKSSGGQTLVSALRLVLAGEVYLPPLLLDAAPAEEQPALTGRQAAVLGLLGDGLSNKDIGRRLDLSEKTVKAHVGAVFRALGVVSRTQAVKAARSAGLLAP